jgi:hypothetical protein
VQDEVNERNVDVQVAIVVDEALLGELIQKEIHPGPRGANHLGERFLTHLRQVVEADHIAAVHGAQQPVELLDPGL